MPNKYRHDIAESGVKHQKINLTNNKIYTLTHIYMTAHFPVLAQAIGDIKRSFKWSQHVGRM